MSQGAELPGQPREYLPLPGQVENGTAVYCRCLADLVELVGAEVRPAPLDVRGWRLAAIEALRRQLRGGERLPREFFLPLIRAAVYDPDPSFNRRFIEPALAAFGSQRVLAALLDLLRGGTNQERAGAARAWYWALGLGERRARAATPASRAESAALVDFRTRWQEAALREFVSNDHLDVRRCILPLLSLKPAHYPVELRHLVTQAIEIARTHPDQYIRHRAEIQRDATL